MSRGAQKRSTQVVSARLPRQKLALLKKLYSSQSNQEIIENLIEEKLARKDFDAWMEKLKKASRAGDLDLDQV